MTISLQLGMPILLQRTSAAAGQWLARLPAHYTKDQRVDAIVLALDHVLDGAGERFLPRLDTAEASGRWPVTSMAAMQQALAETLAETTLRVQAEPARLRDLVATTRTEGTQGLGNLLTDLGRAFSTGGDSLARVAADLACSGAFQSVAAAGIAQQMGGQAGRDYREQVRQASAACSPQTYQAQQETRTETTWVTIAWIVTGMAALGTALAVYLATRTPVKNAKRSRHRNGASSRRGVSLDAFTQAYVEAALWSSTTADGTPLDRNYGVGDITRATLAKMIADCKRFQAQNADDLATGADERGGHDFWLTRNRHGAGFWDGDWSEPAATRLTNAAHAFGEIDLYVSRGKVHST